MSNRLALAAADAAGTNGLPSATETIEALNNAQEGLQEIAKNPGLLREWLDGLMPELLNFAFQVVIALVFYAIGSRVIRSVVKMVHRSMERAGTDAGVKQFVLPLLKYSLYLFLVFLIMGLFGIATTSVVAIFGSVGVAVGLALQGSLSNLAGGVLILLLKPFRVGDYIIEDTNKNEGTVSEISIFYTKLLTPDNRMIVIPNGTLSNSSLTNVSHMDRRRIDVTVGIAYQSDLKKAKAVLYAAAEKETARIPEEEIIVMVDSFGDSAMNMGVKMWVSAAEYWPARWRLMENIKYALDENGLVIPFPQMDITVKASDSV